MARKKEDDVAEFDSTVVQEEDITSLNPLRNETVIVRYIQKKSKMFDDPKHILFGGLSESVTRTFSVPLLRNGQFANILTNAEKKFFERTMGLQEGALSVHKKENNYWSSKNPEATVNLNKYDTYLDLSSPIDYIKYKILLANKDVICPDSKTLQDYPKESYQYVLIKSNDELDDKKNRMTNIMECYKEYGKIESDAYKLRTIIELIIRKPLADNTKLSWMQVKCNDLMQEQTKQFLATIKDPLLDTKILIRRSVESGMLSNRAGQYYMRRDGSPLCGNGEEPTLGVAARWLNEPNHQDIKLSLMEKLDDKKLD